MESQPSIFAGRVERHGMVFFGPVPLAAAESELFGWSGIYSVVTVLPPSRRSMSAKADVYEELYVGEAADVGRALAAAAERACWRKESGNRSLLVFFRAVEGGAETTMERRRLVATCLRAGVPPCNRPR